MFNARGQMVAADGRILAEPSMHSTAGNYLSGGHERPTARPASADAAQIAKMRTMATTGLSAAELRDFDAIELRRNLSALDGQGDSKAGAAQARRMRETMTAGLSAEEREQCAQIELARLGR